MIYKKDMKCKRLTGRLSGFKVESVCLFGAASLRQKQKLKAIVQGGGSYLNLQLRWNYRPVLKNLGGKKAHLAPLYK